MESTRPRPPGAVDLASIPDVAAIYDTSGPFVSVFLDTEPAVENARSRNELRWKGIRDQLFEEGAPPEALAAVDPLVADAHTRGAALAAISNPTGLRLVRHEPDPPRRDLARVGPLAHLGPVLEWEQNSVPHVVVLADRAGADLAALTRSGREVLTSAGAHQGDDPHLRRSAPGGWSQRRYQQRAENLWEERAGETAEVVMALADEIGARLIALAGDVRATQLLREALPERTDQLVHLVDGSRSVDGGLDALAEETVRLAATVAAEDTVACLRQFREEAGRDGQAVEGVEATLAALTQARVDTLLVHDDPDDDRTAWFGSGALTAATRSPLVELGEDQPVPGRLVDVALRAALNSGAAVRMIPDVVSGGLAGLLRY